MAPKNFKSSLNPAMQFISSPEENTNDILEEKKEIAPDGYKVNPVYIETKSRRLQLLLKPSLHSKLKEAASRNSQSLNDFIHTALEEYTGDM